MKYSDLKLTWASREFLLGGGGRELTNSINEFFLNSIQRNLQRSFADTINVCYRFSSVSAVSVEGFHNILGSLIYSHIMYNAKQ